MERSKSIEILKKLATGTDGRSESARLADIIEDVENALKAGVKRQSVLNALHDHYGFKMTMSGFEKALRKLRNTKTPIPITTETNNLLVPYTRDENVEATFHDRASNNIDDSKKHLTPKKIRSIREKTLNELDNDYSGNYD